MIAKKWPMQWKPFDLIYWSGIQFKPRPWRRLRAVRSPPAPYVLSPWLGTPLKNYRPKSQSLPQSFGVMPEVYLLKKLNPDNTIWNHYPENDVVRSVGENEEEARSCTARGDRSGPWFLLSGLCCWSELSLFIISQVVSCPYVGFDYFSYLRLTSPKLSLKEKRIKRRIP